MVNFFSKNHISKCHLMRFESYSQQHQSPNSRCPPLESFLQAVTVHKRNHQRLSCLTFTQRTEELQKQNGMESKHSQVFFFSLCHVVIPPAVGWWYMDDLLLKEANLVKVNFARLLRPRMRGSHQRARILQICALTNCFVFVVIICCLVVERNIGDVE